MACPGENELLDAMEGRAPKAQRLELAQHLLGCEACRLLLATSQQATSTLMDSPETADAAVARALRFDEADDALLGSTVGEYVVEEVIGQGGMGIVYRGHHPLIGKAVAIKILRPELAADVAHTRRMLGEARAVNAIAHRSIVDVFAFGELADGRQYMVMEYLQGEPLNRLIRTQAPLPQWKLLELLDGILEALAAAHAAGVIHRDLKPSNLYLVTEPDGKRFVKLLDFGLAKRERDGQGQTRVGRAVLGTPGYMAPEQIRAQPVSPRTDLYALGVIAWEMAVGRRPFRGANALQMVRAQMETNPTRPSKHAPGLSEGLDRLIMSLMAKDPAHRPESAEAVRRELKRLAQAEPANEPTENEGRALPRRSRLPWALGGAGAMALAGLVGWAVVRSQAGPEQPTSAASPPLEAKVKPLPLSAVEPLPPPPSLRPMEPPPEPPAEDLVAPAASEPVAVRPASPRAPAPGRLSQKALLERTGKLRRRLKQATAPGEEPDRLTSMLLDNAQRDAASARSDAELQRVEKTLADIERKYFKP